MDIGEEYKADNDIHIIYGACVNKDEKGYSDIYNNAYILVW